MVVVFLHGWGVRHLDYGALPDWLRERLGANVVDVWLSQYVTDADSVTMGDLVLAFERARKESFPEAHFACVTHSTGGPVAREWLARYGDCGMMTHLVMLAPPNHGSALAQLGKGRLSRMAMLLEHREPGEQILNWLELGSRESWHLNTAYLEQPPEAFQFSLIGSGIDRKLYDHLNSYTGEKGSDGVVRAAAANLNFGLVELKQRGAQLAMAGRQRSVTSAFGILPRLSHSGHTMGILSSITRENAGEHLTAKWVERCLRVTDSEGYVSVSEELAQTCKSEATVGSQIIFRVKDAAGRPVKDFDLSLTASSAYSPDALPAGFFRDRQRNQVSPNTLTYFVDHTVFEPMRELGLRIAARPSSGPVSFTAAEFRSEEAVVSTFLRGHETVMVDIQLERNVDQAVFQLRRAA